MSTPPPSQRPLGPLNQPERPPLPHEQYPLKERSQKPDLITRSGLRQRRTQVLLGCLVAAALWSTGTFDKQLVGMGLNAKPCVVSPLFGTRCGKEAEALLELKQKLENVGEEGSP